MPFCKHCAFNDREILAEIVFTSDIATCQRQIPKNITAFSYETGSILIKKCRAIEIVIRGVAGECAIGWVFRAAAGQSWVERGLVWAINRDSRDEAVFEVTATERWGGCKAVHRNGGAALVAVHASDLPTAEHYAGRSMIKIFFSRTGGEFVKVADDNGVRSVLIAQGLFRF